MQQARHPPDNAANEIMQLLLSNLPTCRLLGCNAAPDQAREARDLPARHQRPAHRVWPGHPADVRRRLPHQISGARHLTSTAHTRTEALPAARRLPTGLTAGGGGRTTVRFMAGNYDLAITWAALAGARSARHPPDNATKEMMQLLSNLPTCRLFGRNATPDQHAG